MSSSASSQSGLAMMAHGHIPRHRGLDHSTQQQQQQQQQTLYHPQPQQQQRHRNHSGSNNVEGGKRPHHHQEQQQRGERQRGRTNSNSGNHSQYASKFSSSNSNIIHQQSPMGGRGQHHRTTASVASAIATLAHVGASSLGMNPSHMSTTSDSTSASTVSSAMGHHSSSTTTTFYSGVKLAPPVLSASVMAYPLMEHQHQHQHNAKGLDPKTWYTIQVQPCDLILPSSTSTAIGATSKGTLETQSATSIRRKSYRIYRRYEDVVDFADQLEEEFPELIAPHQPSVTMSSAAISNVVNGNGAHRTLTHKGDLTSTAILDSVRGHSLGVAGNHPMVTKSATPASATVTSAPHGPTGTGALDHENAMVSLPRLRSKLVLFATKAACLQRKEELDRYLADLFALGPIMAQSRLVAEFFGIWKTDMEMHLSQEDRDPLALHSGITTAPTVGTGSIGAAVADMAVSQTDAGVLPALTNDTKDGKQSQGSGASRVHARDPISRTDDGNKVNEEELELDSNDIQAIISAALHPNTTTAQTSPSFSSSSSFASPSVSLHHSASSLMPSSSVFTTTTTFLSTNDNKPGRLHLQSNIRDSDFDTHTAYLASPALSPNPITMSCQSFPEDSDSEMTSPTTIEEIDPASLIEETVEYGPTAENGRPLVDDIATRTLKKFKSLRRSHTSTTSSQQHLAQQDQRSGSQISMLSSHASSSTNSSSSPSTVIAGGLSSSSTQPTRTKVMKRSKTAVFRTEVSMQPLLSRNVIPPWNRIPSSISTSTTESSASSRVALISPVSPISPGDRSSSLINHGSRASSPSAEEPNPFDIRALGLSSEERSRPLKLTMTHSKTMPTLNMWDEEYSAAESSLGGTTMTKSLSANHAEQPESRLGTAGIGGRSMSVSSGTPASFSSSTGATPTTAPLIAPWNRVDPNSETNTHLHSLIKISGQASPSILGASNAANSPFVPVELGRSFLKKESAAATAATKKSNTMSARALLEHQRVVPVLSLPPSKVKSTVSSNEDAAPAKSSYSSDAATVPPKRKGMTHSISAPSGLVPKMVISAPKESSQVLRRAETQDTHRGDARKPLPKRASLASSVALSSSEMDYTSPVSGSFPAGTTVATALTKKRSPRRESGPHSPSMTTKQPVGILKKTAHQPPPQYLLGGSRKASLNVPTSGIFPVQPQSLHSILGSAGGGGGGSLSSSPIPSPTLSSSLTTTFKIVMDADTIVALQVVEDKDFLLTLSDLQARVRSKLLKSNIHLPEKFDLIWSSVASASGTSALALAAASVESAGNTPLKTDVDLHTAILGSRNHKVTLRCNV